MRTKYLSSFENKGYLKKITKSKRELSFLKKK